MRKAAEGDQRETWRDWQDKRAPEPPLMTRAEVLELLERWHSQRKVERKVEERTLRYWEKEGLIPRPTLEHRGGVTRTWYPSWVVDLIAVLRSKQHGGRKLADLRDDLRAEARRLSRKPRPYPPVPVTGASEPLERYFAQRAPRLLEDLRLYLDGPDYGPPPTFDPPTLPEPLERLIAYDLDLAIRDQYRRHHFNTTRIEVRLLDATGQARTYVVPLPADYDPDPFEAAFAALSAHANLDEGEAGQVTPPPPP